MANTQRTREAERAAQLAGELNGRNIDDAEYIAGHPGDFTSAELALAMQTISEHDAKEEG